MREPTARERQILRVLAGGEILRPCFWGCRLVWIAGDLITTIQTVNRLERAGWIGRPSLAYPFRVITRAGLVAAGTRELECLF